jgi:hypothetical protein
MEQIHASVTQSLQLKPFIRKTTVETERRLTGPESLPLSTFADPLLAQRIAKQLSAVRADLILLRIRQAAG